MHHRFLRSALFIAFTVFGAAAAAESDLSEHERFALDVYKKVMSFDTTHSTGRTQEATEALRDILLQEGIPEEDVTIVTHGASTAGHPKGNLVARLRAEDPIAKPVLLLAHIDVVEADPADWSPDISPMKLTEKDGYFYGRGTIDDKDEVAIHFANFVRLHREKVPLKRDLIVAITSDEEGGPHNGVLHLLEEHRALVDAAFVINEGGGGLIRDGRYIANSVQTAEKVYQSYTLEVTNPGGHSSLPRSDNAIYELARALLAIESYHFPVMLNETTRAHFVGRSSIEAPSPAAMIKGLLQNPPSPEAVAYFQENSAVNARLRTTCIATQLEAGHAENALPQRARATVNCRVFPGIPVAQIRQTLIDVVANEGVTITPINDARASDASPLTDEVMNPIRAITQEMWPGATVLPAMSTGATDGLFFRNAGIPVYGVSGIFVKDGDYRAHGRDERILKSSFYEGLDFLYQLTRAVTVSEDEPMPPTTLQESGS